MDHPKTDSFKKARREKRSVTMVYILLRTSVVLVMLAQIFNRNFENVFLCVLTLLLFMMPSLMERKLDIALPNTLEIIILLFIYAAEIMGEIGAYYVNYPLLGYGPAHAERLFVRCHRLFPAGHSEPPQRSAVSSFPPVSGHRSVLLLDDGGRYLGIF